MIPRLSKSVKIEASYGLCHQVKFRPGVKFRPRPEMTKKNVMSHDDHTHAHTRRIFFPFCVLYFGAFSVFCDEMTRFAKSERIPEKQANINSSKILTQTDPLKIPHTRT
jgi:hypothetical protein